MRILHLLSGMDSFEGPGKVSSIHREHLFIIQTYQTNAFQCQILINKIETLT